MLLVVVAVLAPAAVAHFTDGEYLPAGVSAVVVAIDCFIVFRINRHPDRKEIA